MTLQSKNTKNIGRLKKRPEFLWVRENGQKWVSKGLIIELAPTDKDFWCYGVTVTKKVSTKAVTRNRIKRRLRAIADEILQQYPSNPHNIVIIGRHSTEDKDFEVLKRDLTWCLQKLGVEQG